MASPTDSDEVDARCQVAILDQTIQHGAKTEQLLLAGLLELVPLLLVVLGEIPIHIETMLGIIAPLFVGDTLEVVSRHGLNEAVQLVVLHLVDGLRLATEHGLGCGHGHLLGDPLLGSHVLPELADEVDGHVNQASRTGQADESPDQPDAQEGAGGAGHHPRVLLEEVVVERVLVHDCCPLVAVNGRVTARTGCISRC